MSAATVAHDAAGSTPEPAWAVLQGLFTALEGICKREQEALVRLDGEAVATLTPRKQALLTAVNQTSVRMSAQDLQSPPAEVQRLAERCHRLNGLNRRLLALTVNRMQALLNKLAAGDDPRYGPSTLRRLPGRIDSRV